jgi:biopolymer transport protein ExbD
MAFSASSSSQSSEINVTPLIDVLLVLLIIFMVIVPIAPRGLESGLPQGKPLSPALPPVTVRILGTGTGTDPALPVLYRANGRTVAAAELQPLLRSLFAVRQDRTLFVEADRGLSYRQVAAVVGEGKSAGAAQVSLQSGGAGEQSKFPGR